MTASTATARPLLVTHKGSEPILVTAIDTGHGLRDELHQMIETVL